MRKLILLGLLFVAADCSAQFPFTPPGDTAHNVLDINNVATRVNGLGDLWADVDNQTAACIFPAGSGKTLAYAGALWMAGYDDGGTLRVAAQTYRQNGLDYKAGPEMIWISDDSTWRKVWKISKPDINTFLSHTTHTLENTPAHILDWPAKNNPYAKDRFGNPLTITTDMAPFIDVDGDGNYNPLLGDYPAMKGDQMLWHVYNDVRLPHFETGSTPMFILIKQSVYGFDRGTLIDNVVYYEFELTNAAPIAYTNFRAAFFADLDLGFAFDDYLGFDATYRLGLGFNGASYDSVYGSTIPAVGIALMETPGDAFGALQPVGSFATYSNDFSPTGNPESGADFYNYMNGRNKAGATLHHDSLYGVDLTLAGGSTYECLSSAPVYDLRFVLASPDITFPAGATRTYAYAMVVAPEAGGCPVVDLTGLAEVTDTALYYYYNPPALGVASLTKETTLHLYPNPATQQIHLTTARQVLYVNARNTLGQLTPIAFQQTGEKVTVDVAALSTGIYTLSVSGKNFQEHAVFVKQ